MVTKRLVISNLYGKCTHTHIRLLQLDWRILRIEHQQEYRYVSNCNIAWSLTSVNSLHLDLTRANLKFSQWFFLFDKVTNRNHYNFLNIFCKRRKFVLFFLISYYFSNAFRTRFSKPFLNCFVFIPLHTSSGNLAYWGGSGVAL